MAKVNVSLPDELLLEVDRITEELNCSRSGFVAEATAQYLTRKREEIAAEERRRSIEAAMRSAREIAATMPDGPDLTEIIRRDRDSNHGHGAFDE
jgi:metal-responsive CopG/Arc/MetJ family transcriptional regulator